MSAKVGFNKGIDAFRKENSGGAIEIINLVTNYMKRYHDDYTRFDMFCGEIGMTFGTQVANIGDKEDNRFIPYVSYSIDNKLGKEVSIECIAENCPYKKIEEAYERLAREIVYILNGNRKLCDEIVNQTKRIENEIRN